MSNPIDGLQEYLEGAVEEGLGRKAWLVEWDVREEFEPYQGFGFGPGIRHTDIVLRIRLGGER